MSYNNYYSGNKGGNYRGGGSGGFGGRSSYGGGYGGGYNHEKPIYFPSQLNRQDMYKSGGYGRYSNQEQRRQSLLTEQRNRRSNVQNKGRNFGPPQQKKKKFPTAPPKPREYKDILSYSEYLVERPDDLEQWVVVACPKGKRCTLVAHKGITTAYDKHGKPVDSFLSHLPGGCDIACLMSTHGGMRKTILDCVYSEADSTYYVLDIIMWNLHPFVECETTLRFFWLTTRLEEVDVAAKAKSNQFRILPAARFPVIQMQESLSQVGLYPENKPVVDGFLFYHPEAIYMSGTTPLVGWLKGFMIPEIISHVQVHSSYLEEKPADYTTLAEHVAQHGNSYGKKNKKKKAGAAEAGDKMETDAALPKESSKQDTVTAMED